jgi:hypothetical protein
MGDDDKICKPRNCNRRVISIAASEKINKNRARLGAVRYHLPIML